MPPGFYTVHLKFAELWLAKKGQRPMDIEVNGERYSEVVGSGDHGRTHANGR